MIKYSNCKINIGLYIERKREDGFHSIKTLFYPIELSDTIEIKESTNGKLNLEIYGLSVDGTLENNLCIKAYNLLKADFDIPPVLIKLTKNIPTGAGLGGGSSNAVTTLKMLNEIFELRLTNKQLYNYAIKLGSDCAFFVENKPILASGRGDVLKEIDFSLKGYNILLMKPSINVDTAWAYKQITPRNSSIDILNLLKSPLEKWKNTILNDFEKAVFEYYPVIANLKEKLYSKGAIYASMSGSGSAIYGIFKEVPHNIEFEESFVWQGNGFY